MKNFVLWCMLNSVKINWFLIGLNAMGLSMYVGRGDWYMAAITFIVLTALLIIARDEVKQDAGQ
jgi:hypothetical protein